jgi:Fe-S cluster biosynthesis and repair protein YggX
METDKPFYINKCGQKVFVKITIHALKSFAMRYRILMDKEPPFEVKTMIIYKFNRASLIKNMNRHFLERKKKHGNDTLYFRTGPFVFVVQQASIITVEIAKTGKRYLNKFKSNQ